MPILRYKGFEIDCKTPQEAADVIARVEAGGTKNLATLAKVFEALQNPYWTREKFWKFVESLGEPQERLLKLLVRKQKVSADEMRKTLKLDSNQQLAGVLSGISKQAGSHDIPARAVFTIDNESQSREVTKTYVIAIDFLKMAADQAWPAD